MPGQIVVVKRPRGGPFAVVRNWPTWWRAFWLGERLREARPGEVDAGSLGETLAVDRSRPDAVVDGADGLATLEAAVGERGGVWTRDAWGRASIEVEAAEALAWLRFLRESATPAFDVLFDLAVIDRLPASPRFEVLYRLRSSDTRAEIVLRTRVADDGAPALDSVVSLWRCADWLEREIHDLFGIRFRGHPRLQPLLVEAGFGGHPLRRDFVPPRDGADVR